jgi:hypothetical protein
MTTNPEFRLNTIYFKKILTGHFLFPFLLERDD